MWQSFSGVFPNASTESNQLQKLSRGELPRHLAIIMDGNGRWAEKKKLSRAEGHRKGGEAAERIIEYSTRLGIPYLTLYTFSTENWNRPVREVRFLFSLLQESLIAKRKILMENDIRFFVLGDLEDIPVRLRKRLAELMEISRKNQRMQLNLAFNYGSRIEIIKAVQRIISDKVSADQIDEKSFGNFLFTVGIPDPDLIIRTSGELRISNFLLYQSAYSEFYFTPVLWPDFQAKDFFDALLSYQKRARRYGLR